MIYLPIVKSKRLIILFLSILCFHIILLSSKHYSSDSDHFAFSGFNENQCSNYINSIKSLGARIDLIQNTRITYLYLFPEWILIFMYVSYLFIAIRFILISKIKTDE